MRKINSNTKVNCYKVKLNESNIKNITSKYDCKYYCLGNTALHHAIKGRSLEVADQLMKNGASLVIENKESQTPLSMTDSEGKYKLFVF